MRIAWLIVLLALYAPTAAARIAPSFGSFADGDPCVWIKSEYTRTGNGVVCMAGTTDAQERAWWLRVNTLPVLDDRERQALAWCKPASAADIVTTGVALTICKTAFEANPLFAWLPTGGIVVLNSIVSYVVCAQFEKLAHETPLANSAANHVWLYNTVRFTAGAWNAGVIARCAK